MPRSPRDKDDLIAQTMAAMRAFQVAVDEVDEQVARRARINRTDLRCLDVLTGAGEPMSAGALAELTGLTTGGTTVVLDRLELAGFVQRVPHPQDRRRVNVKATAKARRLIDKLYGDLGRVARERLEGMPATELRVVSEFLDGAREMNQAHAAELSRRAPQRAAGRRRGPLPAG
jgi:DNA-binding MarR family transcriptional regulator